MTDPEIAWRPRYLLGTMERRSSGEAASPAASTPHVPDECVLVAAGEGANPGSARRQQPRVGDAAERKARRTHRDVLDRVVALAADHRGAEAAAGRPDQHCEAVA